ncbi:arginine deiminase [Gordonia sp. DT30]|uniref:arginine deiminase n=1 Tax=Gordonia sp. DT30 TaxID=3416546 RepID=UPI003CEFDB4D
MATGPARPAPAARTGTESPALGCTTEVGRLRTVMLHRPGPELARLSAANSAEYLFGRAPDLVRAREQHDAFAGALRERGVEVLLLGDLLVEAIEHSGAARIQGITAAVSVRRLGPHLGAELGKYLRTLPAADLACILTAGITFGELPDISVSTSSSLVRQMHHGDDFAIDPLPNLIYSRDSSFWIRSRFAISSLARRARAREASLVDLIYAHHPRFLGARRAYESRVAPVEGGDVLLLAPGVVAVGVGERTTPAGAEALAHSLFADDLAHTVLAIPMHRSGVFMHLGTMCTMVDTDAMVVHPAMADDMSAFTVHDDGAGGVAVSPARPFAEAAAAAMGRERIRFLDPGIAVGVTDNGEWNDSSNTLAIAPGVVVSYRHNSDTNRRLGDSGIEVIEIDASELDAGRGGPRCMACPLARDEV